MGLTLTSPEHLEWMVTHLDLRPHLDVLDVAAGTGHLGRAIAPHVRRVVAVDATAEMLIEGRRQAEQDGIENIVFEEGLAEQLTYPTDTFDLVVSRFAIHHFEDPRAPIAEMVRVCRPGGRVAVIDLIAPEDEAAALPYNRLERMRDPSHTRALAASEIHRLLGEAGLDVVRAVSREVHVDVERWLDLAETEPEMRRTIVEELTQELKGLQISGMRPFLRENQLTYVQTWLIAMGVKGGARRC
jgi:ubiquinone/menaquinone biosynthesis C-methylase UbiE